jgi:hypothetical protein
VSPTASLNSIAGPPTRHPAQPLPPKLKRRLAAAAAQRRGSRRTVEERMANLSGRVLGMLKHYPLHGIQLLEYFEELADGVEFTLPAG